MLKIELLSVAGCPHVDAARKLLNDCVEELHVRAQIEEKVGDYPSPTIRIDGEDVMGVATVCGGCLSARYPDSRAHSGCTAPERKSCTRTLDKSLRAGRWLQVGG
jgi:hypothetical protein